MSSTNSTERDFNTSLLVERGKSLEVKSLESLTPSTQPPVILVGGWGSNISTYEPTMREFSTLGITTYTVVPTREGSSKSNNDLNIAEIELNKAQGVNLLLYDLGKKGIENVNLVVHSEGGIIGTLAALLHSQENKKPKIDSLTLVTPAGLNGRDSTISLALRFLAQGVRSAMLNPQLYRRNKSAKSFSSPLLALRELRAISNTDILPMLRILNELFGIKINLIAGKNDPVFPTRRLKRAADQTDFINFKELDIRHNGILVRPEIVVGEIYNLLTS